MSTAARSTATSRSGSDVAPPRWLILGNPDGRRVALFQEALAAMVRPPAAVVSWADLLADRARLSDAVRRGDLVRVESPGRDFGVERRLLALGAAGAEAEGGPFLPAADAANLAFDRGALLYPRQWYLGFRHALRFLIAAQLSEAPPHTPLNDPEEVALLFDKPACQERLADAGVPVPRPLALVRGWEDLQAKMTAAGVSRVFVKLAHGSSASGVVAYRQSGDGRRCQAVTTVETAQSGGRTLLYNTRRVRVLEDAAEIAALVDALAPHRAAAETWLPKASLSGRGAFDVRALAVGARMRHVVGRCSRSPLTNLHLLNGRADAGEVRRHVGETAWSLLDETVARAASVFPRSLHVGLDVTWTPGFRHLAVLEANAFGDLLPGALSDGESAYAAEIRVAEAGFRANAASGSVTAC